MKIYLDIVFILNFLLDFILLMGVAYILRRNVSIRRIVLGSIFGSMSLIVLFFGISDQLLFVIKIIISIIMVLITFNYRDIRYTFKNIIYLYILSIMLGGSLYLLNIQFSYKHIGFIFYNRGPLVSYSFILITGSFIYYLYIKQLKKLKLDYSNYQEVIIIFNDNIINCTGYVDSGNNLRDPTTSYLVILIDKNKIKFDVNNTKVLLVPFNTASGSGVLKCIKPTKIFINNKLVKDNYLVGILEHDIGIDGVDVLLNNNIMEDIYD